jgi:hypothetical protein
VLNGHSEVRLDLPPAARVDVDDAEATQSALLIVRGSSDLDIAPGCRNPLGE